MTPPSLAAWLHSLPPILHGSVQTPTSSCSKAPRGLFVLLRVGRIYTASSISPSLWLRQRSSRYTIRAGQNLPDKEFRSVHPILFPRGPDSILIDHGSSPPSNGGSQRRLPASDVHDPSFSAAPSGT